jgi:hypothetical protein
MSEFPSQTIKKKLHFITKIITFACDEWTPQKDMKFKKVHFIMLKLNFRFLPLKHLIQSKKS